MMLEKHTMSWKVKANANKTNNYGLDIAGNWFSQLLRLPYLILLPLYEVPILY